MFKSKFFSAMAFNAVLSLVLTSAMHQLGADVSAPMMMIGIGAASFALSFAPLPTGVLRDVVLVEAWEAELLTAFRATRSWMGRIPRKDALVRANVLNVSEIGADPTVLINNSTFPIATATRTDNNIPLALNRYDTTNTKIPAIELRGLPYDKEGSAIRQHKDVLVEQTGAYGLWNLAVNGDSGNTPLVETTGADNGNGRKRLTVADLIRLKNRMDTLSVPQSGRVLVLCPDHVSDLLLQDASFAMRYNNTKTGEVIPQYGFEIFEDVATVKYSAANAKKAFGANPAGTDRNASVCFLAPRTYQASGDVEMFHRMATDDPENRATVLGFGVYHLIGPVKNLGFGVLVSDDTL